MIFFNPKNKLNLLATNNNEQFHSTSKHQKKAHQKFLSSPDYFDRIKRAQRL